MRGILLVALVLAGAFPPAGATGHGTVHQDLLIEVGLDRTEQVTWSVRGERAAPSGVLLPEGASEIALTSFGRAIEHRAAPQPDGRILVTPAHGQTQFIVQARAPAPDGSLHPLYTQRWEIAGSPSAADSIAARVRAPAAFAIVHASPGAIASDARSASASATSGATFVYAYRAPHDPTSGLIEIEEGIYRIVGAAAAEPEMRELARIATNASTLAAEQAGLPLRAPYWVRFAPERAFAWETGFYGYDGVIALRRSHLENDSVSGWPWAAAETLVHETFHATSVPAGTGRLGTNATWWIEGTARHAERFVSGDDGWRACEGTWCWTFQSQLRAKVLDDLYASEWSFDPGWTPDDLTSESARARQYEYSSFLVAAYVARYGRDAYAAAWSDVRRGLNDPACACDEAWLRATLVRHSGGRLSDDELYAPFRDLRVEDPPLYERTIRPLVADEPREGAPVPSTLPPRAGNAPSEPPLPPGIAPHIAWVEGEEPRRVSWATLVTLHVRDLDVNATPASGLPHARLRWRLDGAEVEPRLEVRGDRAYATFRDVRGGIHHLEVEARRPGGGSFSPMLLLERSFSLPHAYLLEFVEPTNETIGGGARIVGRLSDALVGTPFAGRGVTLEADGIPIHVNVTDETGLVGFTLPGAAVGPLTLALTMDDDPEAPPARAERMYLVREPTSAAAPQVPGAVVGPEPREAPGPELGALVAVALLSALAARRGARPPGRAA